jgi:LmbE family N-acetylglucosaminyl deacetylase
MKRELRLLCVLAHPDDESLAVGGTLAKYAAEGILTYLLTATRGEHGPRGLLANNTGPLALSRVREAELRAAVALLNVHEVESLDYVDGELDQVEPGEAIARIAGHIRRVRPQVVVTFGPDGLSGHPDHIAISQLTTAAILCAATSADANDGPASAQAMNVPPHQVSKLYYLVDSRKRIDAHEAIYAQVTIPLDGVARRGAGWEDWAITTRLDTTAHWEQVRRAVECHQTQIACFEPLIGLTGDQHRRLWSTQEFYRVFSLVNGGRVVETDLFAGLR